MEPTLNLPDHVRKLTSDEKFQFSCHPGVSCFTDCCRELELALSPYDIVRLKNNLQITSGQFLADYCLIECNEQDALPRVYLGMVNDGRASCPFVSEKGCQVYDGRPAACRTYPLGRAAYQEEDGTSKAIFVLLQEPHCHGFAEPFSQDISAWNKDQELQEYNHLNDELMKIIHHPSIKNGAILSQQEQKLFLDTLYDLDAFRASNKIKENSTFKDEELLALAIKWLPNQLFAS